MASMDATVDTRARLLQRADVLRASEPNFARFLTATTNAADADDLNLYAAEIVEAMLRKTYTRLGKREGRGYVIHHFPPETPIVADRLEIFSADMPFIVDSTLAAIRAKGGSIRFIAHPVLNLDPESYRVLDDKAPVTVKESLLIVHLAPFADATQRDAVLAEVEGTLVEVFRATRAWRSMLERLRRVVEEWKLHPPQAPAPMIQESKEFLAWLAEHNFTFLGMREYRIEGEGPEAHLVPMVTTGIGLLEDKDFHFLRSGTNYVESTAQHDAFLTDPEPLMVTKANVKTRVHRRAHMDYVGVKLYRDGRVSGELRIIGLFTSMALATPNTDVPLVRHKVAEVMRRSGYDPASHSGKALMAALETYPRDELFQIKDDLLYEFAKEVAALPDRPRVHVLPRIDRFDNFVSILVYVPRDRYTSDARERIGLHLARVYDGRVSAYYPHFPEGEMVRVHFIIGRNGGPTPRPPRDRLEAEVEDLIRTYADRLAAAAGERDIAAWAQAFPAAYQARNGAVQALADIAVFEALPDEANLALKLDQREGSDGAYALKVYHRGRPIPLSDRVPMLERFGFRVIDELTYTISPAGLPLGYIHDMLLDVPGAAIADFTARAPLVEQAILAVWQIEAESDGLNQLILRTGLDWTDVSILRALLRYFRQIGSTWSPAYVEQVLIGHADVAVALVRLFHAQLDMNFAGNRERAIAEAHEVIAAALDATQSIDEDRILRRLANLLDAAVRTNAFQRDAHGQRRPALAIKFDCSRIESLPEPRPYREIFVYSPRVEGLHLRFGAIARGGLRWSDRPEDFRTEVLGLVKAQQVKNAIIVPVGAKGAFVPKLISPGADRETVQREGTACYKIFVSTLLDVTDNLNGDVVLPPPDVRRRDGDDPYLVVAADKGTATFSDTANTIALERGFWLGDAFASGGSNGYDHKKMGITARGAWEAVKRHFRELDRDIQTTPFTVVGVGDMSGDVFGNGMLLSPEIRLVAAFDHRDIFIDPVPDPAVALAERRRLFALPRSSWQDYDKTLLSQGGGIYSRSLKTIPLSDEARQVLGLGNEPLTTQDVLTAILRAPVDLLWFGGIGTYVRGPDETNAQVGDRANDAIRIAGPEIRAKVVGEGANLAVTQRGRIAYALAGGRIETDAIDNSAGVNASDIEVNVKIALSTVVRSGLLDTEGRNAFLAELTPEVAALCLANNYLQTLALSLAERAGLAALPDHRALIQSLEQRGLLNRSLEALPDDKTLDARARDGRGLTRPELATLLAYAKNALYADLLASPAPDDPDLSQELYRYFPPTLNRTYPDAVGTHRLRREVIATVLANAIVNRGGPGFVPRLLAAAATDPAQIAVAFCIVRDAYGLERLYSDIDALDGRIGGAAQLALYAELQALLERETLWLLRNADWTQPVGELVVTYAQGINDVRAVVAAGAPPAIADAIAARRDGLVAEGAPEAVANAIAELDALSYATDITQVAQRAGSRVDEAAIAFLGLADLFGLPPVLAEARALVLSDPFDRLALDRATANLLRAQRDLTFDVLAAGQGSVETRLAAWRAARPDAVDRAAAAVAALTRGEMSVSRLSVAAGLLSDLARSA